MSDVSTPPSNGEPDPGTPEPSRRLGLWERIPKTIPHTRARTSTVVLGLLFLALFWWYLNLYAQFVPQEQRRGPAAATTTSQPARPAPTEETLITTTPRATSSAVPSSGAEGESGAPSTVPGASGASAPVEAPATTTTSGGIQLPGGITLPLPPGTATAPAPSDGAPTTTLPPG